MRLAAMLATNDIALEAPADAASMKFTSDLIYNAHTVVAPEAKSKFITVV